MQPLIYTFEVYIHPCTLETVYIKPPENTTFDLGSESQKLPYSYEQVPDCQYPNEAFFSSNLPAYMEHQTLEKSIFFP